MSDRKEGGLRLLTLGEIKIAKKISNSILLVISAFVLTGCPGSGDRLKADETAIVSKVGEDTCFQVSDAENYRPSLIAINPRGTPALQMSATDSPDLTIKNGKLCIPPDFYQFRNNKQYVVQYILEAPGDKRSPRSVVTGIEFSNGNVKNIPLTDSETTR